MIQANAMSLTRPHFAGATASPAATSRSTQFDSTLSPKEFWDKVVRHQKSTYIGPGMPAALCTQAPGVNTAEKQSFMARHLDRLSEFLRKLNCPNLPAITFNMGKQRFSLKPAGQGVYGMTYQLSTQNGYKQDSFAYKVYWKPVMYDLMNDNRDGPVGEMMNGLLFNNRASDIPEFYMGNAQHKKQWMLSEWIDANTPLKKGKPIAELVKELKLNIHDDHSGNRFQNGYRVDRGGISMLSTVGFWFHRIKTRLTIIAQGVSNFVGNLFDWVFRPGYQKNLKACRSLSTDLTSASATDAPNLRTQLTQALNKAAKRYEPEVTHIQVQP